MPAQFGPSPDGYCSRGRVGKPITSVSAKRATILLLHLADYQKWVDRTEVSFLLMAKFLHKKCLTNFRDLPYRIRLAMLATVLAVLGGC
jgi:hypothetical protein